MINPLRHSSHPENFPDHSHRMICWKSSLAGLLITVMAYLVFTALGAGIGGITASHVINNDGNGSGLATAAGLWLGLTAVMSLFLGSYFAVRVSSFTTTRAGAANAFLIASLFFIFLTWRAGHTMGIIAGEIGRMNGMMIDDAGNATATGVTVTAQDAKAVAEAGWSLFITYVVGLVGAVLGGRTAAHANVERPIYKVHGWTGGAASTTVNPMAGGANVAGNTRGSAAPYVLGWFMGVPASVLFLIFMLRSC